MIGGEGLFERWQAAERQRARAERELAGIERRANAARRLFEALRAERDAARSHYAAPLADAIAELGRPLYGADFAVELSDDLTPVRRILGGKSLLASQLSAGAREQLALLARVGRRASRAACRSGSTTRSVTPTPSGLPRSARCSPPRGLEPGDRADLLAERFRSVPGVRLVELS